jgi:hypothetical protein
MSQFASSLPVDREDADEINFGLDDPLTGACAELGNERKPSTGSSAARLNCR